MAATSLWCTSSDHQRGAAPGSKSYGITLGLGDAADAVSEKNPFSFPSCTRSCINSAPTFPSSPLIVYSYNIRICVTIHFLCSASVPSDWDEKANTRGWYDKPDSVRCIIWGRPWSAPSVHSSRPY